MVFRKEAAPSTRAEFINWYHDQTECSEDHNYEDLDISSPELRSWFLEMIKTFPAMNGPYASDDIDSDYITGYSIGKDSIYIDFRWSVVEDAYSTVVRLAEKHQVGFFDVSSDDGDILFPDDGKLKSIGDKAISVISSDYANVTYYYKKPWWKFW